MRKVTVAEAKAHLSELIGEVSHVGRSVLITRRGRPLAKLVPVDASARLHLADVKGWLADDDPFFELLDDTIAKQ